MVDDPPKYMKANIDAYCWICEHHWRYHYEKGCYVVINRPEVEIMGQPIKYCACGERVNRTKSANPFTN